MQEVPKSRINLIKSIRIESLKQTFSLSDPSNFLSSRFDNFPGATVIGNVVENK